MLARPNPEVLLIEGASVSELKQDLADAIDEYLEDCLAEERAPSKPFSGNLRLRLSSEIHKRATLAAAREGISLNEWIKRVVAATSEQAVSAPSVRPHDAAMA